MRRIVIDTREKRGYSFPDSICRKLEFGDYSLEGLEDKIAIERKSLSDWIGTILRGRQRFSKELKALQNYTFAAVIIEGSIADILSGDYRSEIHPNALLALTCAIIHRYKPVAFLFAGDRPHACALTLELLKQAEEMYGQFPVSSDIIKESRQIV